LGRLSTPEDIGNVVLAVHDGTPVLVKDVGRVVIGIAPRLGEFGYQSQDDAVEGVILLRIGEKTQDVLKRVEAKTRELNEEILPKDVKVLPFYDRSDLVELTTQTVERNLLRGMLLVVVVLIFFLYNFRAGLIVAATIPLALFFAFICLDLQNASANLLSIGAVDFGILVDAAVVMVENIFRQIALRRGKFHQCHGDHPGSRRRSGSPALLLSRGHRGRLPAHLCVGRSFGHPVQTDGRHHGFRTDWFLDRHPDAATIAVRVVHAQGRAGAAQRRVRGPSSPSTPRASIFVSRIFGERPLPRQYYWQVPFCSFRASAPSSCRIWTKARCGCGQPCPTPSHSSESAKIAPKVREILRSFPEVTTVASELGRPDDGTDPTGFFNVEFFVALKPYSQWTGSYRNKTGLTEAISAKLAAFPGINFNYTQPAEDAVDEGGNRTQERSGGQSLRLPIWIPWNRKARR